MGTYVANCTLSCTGTHYSVIQRFEEYWDAQAEQDCSLLTFTGNTPVGGVPDPAFVTAMHQAILNMFHDDIRQDLGLASNQTVQEIQALGDNWVPPSTPSTPHGGGPTTINAIVNTGGSVTQQDWRITAGSHSGDVQLYCAWTYA
jgi:hypothetical protein